tara:strand:- start:2919 stop:3596 length:678 start_codon:yes stop_codon:yes gene_type:complete
MALPTSGALTLNAIHVEAGGSSGTTCSLNDTDIRGLTAASGRTINSTQGTNIDFADFYGASAVTAAADVSLTMTIGGAASTYTQQYVGTTRTRYRGYDSSGSYDSSVTSFGSLSTSSFTNYFGGNTITEIYNYGTSYSTISSAPYGGVKLALRVNAANVSNSNSSFKQMVVGSTTYNRTDATYSTSGSTSLWQWSPGGNAPDNNTDTFTPFAGSGSTVTITFKQA